MSDTTQRWRPPSFFGPEFADKLKETARQRQVWKDMDLSWRNIYDLTYGVHDILNLQTTRVGGVVTSSMQAVSGVANGQRATAGSVKVTGSKLAYATGLTTCTQVVASIDNGSTATNEWVTCRPTPKPTAGGQVDFFVWKPTAAADTTPIASTTARTLRWIAWGT